MTAKWPVSLRSWVTRQKQHVSTLNSSCKRGSDGDTARPIWLCARRDNIEERAEDTWLNWSLPRGWHLQHFHNIDACDIDCGNTTRDVGFLGQVQS